MDFNEQQKKIIETINGPLLCIAGPGSGKTTSIIERVKNMVKSGIEPSSILVVTFTKSAADDMKSRYLADEGTKTGVVFGTIHSVCFRMLRAYDSERYSMDNVLDEYDERQFIRENIKSLRLEKSDQDFIVNAIIGGISVVKNNRVDAEKISIDGCPDGLFENIFNAYEEFKKDNNKIDYDDMISSVAKIFNENDIFLNTWRKKFAYIIIDEFQDTNLLQSEIMYKLAYPQNNICIVGDDDQSIYRFRGAVPRIMLDFEKEFPSCRKVILNVNYRSEPEIVNASKRLIENNTERFEKPLKAFKTGKGKVYTKTFKNRDKEIGQIIKDLKQKQRNGVSLSDTAILYRTNNQAPQLAQQLIKANLPFYTNETVYSIYDSWIFRDIQLFKKVVDGTCTNNEFILIFNRPNRFYARKMLPPTYNEESIMKSAFKISIEWKRNNMRKKIDDWFYWIGKMDGMKPYNFIETIRKNMEYDNFIKTYAENNRLDVSQFTDIINEIQDNAKEFTSYDEWFAFTQKELADFKEKMRQKKKENSVALSTMHKAKGLEWDDVYIVEANEEITPYYKAETEEDMEEERRMFYVAATRARVNLNLFSIEKRNKATMNISRFVREISEDEPVKNTADQGLQEAKSTIEFKPQTWVFHKTFGSGLIMSSGGGKVVISFSGVGVKTLEEKWCSENLQIFG